MSCLLHNQFPSRIDEELLGDGHSYSPRAIHSWLTRALYNRRSKMNPLWNTMVIGGYADGERLVGGQVTGVFDHRTSGVCSFPPRTSL